MDTDYSTDEGKRKTYPEREADVFQRSKRMGRTPDKNTSRDESKLDKVLGLLQDLTSKIDKIENKQDKIVEELKEIKLENARIKQENTELRREIENIKGKLEKVENEKRRNNIVVQGLKIDSNDATTLKEEMKNFMKQELTVDVEIKGTIKLGPRTCLIELYKREDKINIMKNKNKLRKYNRDRIYINDDMTKSERYIQGKIRTKAKEEKRKGKNVKISFQKLIVDMEEWKWNKDREEFEKTGTSRFKEQPKN